MNEKLLRKYARLAVCSGANVQPGQLLVIHGSVRDYRFIEMCVEEAYRAKAGEVRVNWSDENISKMSYENVATEILADIPQWTYDKVKDEHDRGCAYLYVDSDTPGLFKDIDPVKLKTVRMASMKKMEPLRGYTMANKGQWSIVSLPSEGWAKMIFPDDDTDTAVEKLTLAILQAVRIDEDNDPVVQWLQHDEKLQKYCDILNQYQFDRLHFESGLGTDLYVGLVNDHNWAGGKCDTTSGVMFNPNMPTEEVFCMPDKNRVDGKVYASKPLSYSGKVIEDFWFEFKNGRVEDFGAAKEKKTLQDLLDSDEGSRHLGEVALISYHSPISLMNILFYNTLFDENASCHLALGRCYPENLKGGLEMTDEQISQAGGNESMNHVDFMFGTSDMKVTGIRKDGSEVSIFEKGDFVF